MRVVAVFVIGAVVLIGCGDDDTPQLDASVDSGPDTGLDSGPDTGVDSGPDTGLDSGPDDCDGPRQHPLYSAPVEGTCLGQPHAVPGTCVTGNDSMTGNGELFCSVHEGVAYVSFLEFGESLEVEPNDSDAAAPGPDDQALCTEALSRLQWPNDWNQDADGGIACFTTRGCLELLYCPLSD